MQSFNECDEIFDPLTAELYPPTNTTDPWGHKLAAKLDREQSDNPWLVFLDQLRASGVKPPKGTPFMRFASQLYAAHKGQFEDGPDCAPETVIRCKPVTCQQDEYENTNLYSATMELGFYDPADYSESLVAVDTNDPESLLLAKEAEEAEAEAAPPTKFVGCDVVQPKERDEAFPASNFSRPQRPSKAESWDEVMNGVKVCKVDPMWRTFLALARHDAYKERVARRQEFNHAVEVKRAIAHAGEVLHDLSEFNQREGITDDRAYRAKLKAEGWYILPGRVGRS